MTFSGDSHLRCRVVNRPYDIFGTWFSDQHLISGNLLWLAHLVSTSVLWLNKANQEVDSEHVPIMKQLYKFYNRNASSIRSIMVANCPWVEDKSDQNEDTHMACDESSSKHVDTKRAGNPLSQPKVLQAASTSQAGAMENDANTLQTQRNADNSRSIHYLAEFREDFEENRSKSSESSDMDDYEDSDEDEEGRIIKIILIENTISMAPFNILLFSDYFEDEDLENLCPKYLIFSTGSKTYTPHQIGIKRIRSVNFPKKLEPGPSLKERLAAKERERTLQVSIAWILVWNRLYIALNII